MADVVISRAIFTKQNKYLPEVLTTLNTFLLIAISVAIFNENFSGHWCVSVAFNLVFLVLQFIRKSNYLTNKVIKYNQF